jgi:ketosteroid isomerase-like protein
MGGRPATLITSGEEPGMDDHKTARTLAQRMLDGFDSDNVPGLADCVHPDVRAECPFASAGMPAAFVGKGAMMAELSEGQATLAEIAIVIQKTYRCPEDSTLFVEASNTGRLPHGTPYAIRYVFLLGVRDGQVILWREYFDGLIILRLAAAGAIARPSI